MSDPPPELPDRVYVIDTSSIIWIREYVPNASRRDVLSELSQRVDEGVLVFPPHVVKELGKGANKKKGQEDALYRWAKANRAEATRFGECLGVIGTVMAQVGAVVDHEKDSPEDDADPYVLATALHVDGGGGDSTVVTEDRKDMPSKLSIVTAAGILHLPALPMRAYLRTQGIWDSGQLGP